MTKRRRLTDDDLRADPDYQELCRLLKRQAPAQKARTEEWLSQQCEDSQEGGTRTMATDKKALDERIIYLHDVEGLACSKIPARLQAEGYPAMSKWAVQKRYQRAKESQGSHASQVVSPAAGLSQEPQPCEKEAPMTPLCEIGETGEDALTTTPETTNKKPLDETCETSDKGTGEGGEESQDTIPKAWVEPLEKMIEGKLKAMLGISLLSKSPPPLPPAIPKVKGTKRYEGERVTLPGTRVDKVLADAFEQERVKAGVSASEFMQRILWQAFGRPRLSFQRPEDE